MPLLPLMQLLADGRFHSGQALGDALSISRGGVWKQVQALRELDVDVHAVGGKGYRIPGGLQLLDRSRVLAHVDPSLALLFPDFDIQLSIDSTNAEAGRRAADGAATYLVMAEHQSGGRGRRGRTWVSPFGRNIYMSLLWTFQNGIAALEGLSLVCALVVTRALGRLGYAGFSVKWPNDVLYRGRKLAGILLEVSGDISGPCRVVIGIGVNAEMPASAAGQIDQPFSDLLAVSGSQVDRNALAAALINELMLALVEFQKHGFAPFREQWMALDAYAGQQVEIKAGAQSRIGTAAGVDETGSLLLDTAEGNRVVVAGGELMPSLRPLDNGRAG